MCDPKHSNLQDAEEWLDDQLDPAKEDDSDDEEQEKEEEPEEDD